MARRHVNQRELAKRCEVSRMTLRRYLQGGVVRPASALRIVRGLNEIALEDLGLLDEKPQELSQETQRALGLGGEENT